MRYEIKKTPQFNKWFKNLKDLQAKVRIGLRFKRLEKGNFGDHKPINNSFSELRFFFGAGYRIYYTVKGTSIVLLLNGGDKDSQDQDIITTQTIFDTLED